MTNNLLEYDGKVFELVEKPEWNTDFNSCGGCYFDKIPSFIDPCKNCGPSTVYVEVKEK